MGDRRSYFDKLSTNGFFDASPTKKAAVNRGLFRETCIRA